MKTFLLAFLVMFSISCSQNPIEKALKSSNPKIRTVIDNIAAHEVQILFTEVLEINDKVAFKDFSFQVNDSDYFYPASSVKFPVAVLALEKLNQNKHVNLNTKCRVKGDTLVTSFGNEITKLFAVSDNLAYTRLFEFLGQDYINDHLKNKGITSRISHRFSSDNPYDLTTKEIDFYNEDTIIFSSKTSKSNPIKSLQLNKIKKGVGFMKNDTLVQEPMDFSLKNYIPLTGLHNMMKQLMFPSAFPEEKRFSLSDENRQFIIKAMSNLPFEVGYDRAEYYDSYVKFFIYGDSKEQISKDITIHNKVGYAYGYLTDCAYIINHKTNRQYIITATIHVNKNLVFNDDVYEYETIGIPFLAELGRQLVINH